jgi:hypothetical protein
MINEYSVIGGILRSVECKLLLQAVDAPVVSWHTEDLITSFCVFFSLESNLHFLSSLFCKASLFKQNLNKGILFISGIPFRQTLNSSKQSFTAKGMLNFEFQYL